MITEANLEAKPEQIFVSFECRECGRPIEPRHYRCQALQLCKNYMETLRTAKDELDTFFDAVYDVRRDEAGHATG